MRKNTEKKVMEKLEDGTYHVQLILDEYYTQEGVENLIKTYSERLEKRRQEAATLADPEQKHQVIQTVLIGYIGTELIKKYNEDKDNMTEEELEHYNNFYNQVKIMIEQSQTQANQDVENIPNFIEWWTEALEKGHAERFQTLE